ncbi:Dabb family protein [Streptomyces sp. SCSIO ZS0520]|uniref:Dabb family protein n=1 Tax=Streptomyces sp. SCSIO ZS0520 TaxID=2892996 RepID=UPI0021DAD259|nr:Dabb family protein [Streptomyces sp. SCSIO ZS0520]
MIVNLQRFSFKPGVSEEEKAEVLAAMRRTGSVESVAYSAVGQDLGDPADGFTHAYLAAVPDLDALERYMHDPVHLAGDEVILPRLARQSAVRLADDPDPELRQAVFAIYDRKVRKYPAWGRQVEALFGGHPRETREQQEQQEQQG